MGLAPSIVILLHRLPVARRSSIRTQPPRTWLTMTSDSRRTLGAAGESLAAAHLAAAGLRIVERNWRTREGEIDLVAEEDAPDWSQEGTMRTWRVIVEVRTRRGRRYGTALQSVTPRKAAQLRRMGETYVQTVGWRGPWRIDVVAIQLEPSGHLHTIEHVRHAVSG